MKCIPATLVGITLFFGAMLPAKAQRRDLEDPKQLIHARKATFLGGSGTEYLVGANIRSDGRIVVVGSALGPNLALPGHAKVPLLGLKDGVVSSDISFYEKALSPIPLGLPAEKLRERQRMRSRTQICNDPGSTPFFAILSSDVKTVEKAARFPWSSATISSVAFDSDGAIYLTGFANKHFDAVSKAEPLPGDGDGRVYVLKVNAELNRVLWSRVFPSKAVKPILQVIKGNKLVYLGRSRRIFSTDGKLLSQTDGLAAGIKAINPVTGAFAIGGDRNSGTGREPWRQPYLFLYDSDGKLEAKLYQLPGIAVGMDSFRLVSDSAVRGLRYTPDGKELWIAAWSDGGNSIMNLQPYSLTERIADKGLGLTMAGAGATSCCYFLRMNLETMKIENRTIWSGYFKGVQGARMYSLSVAPDGSLIAGGSIGKGMITTSNHVYPGKERTKDWAVGGPAISIFKRTLDRIRFSSPIAATGEMRLLPRNRYEGEAFTFATGTVKGKNRVVAVSIATREQIDGIGQRVSPPLLQPLQSKFGGGACDGYLMVFDW